MKLQNQVCTLEQAKRLKELGTLQTSVACYINGELHLFEKSFYNWAEQKNMDAFAAYTVAELGVCLTHLKNKYSCHTEYNRLWKQWRCFLLDANLDDENKTEAKTEAEARADMLIYLLENNIETPEEVNTRLINS